MTHTINGHKHLETWKALDHLSRESSFRRFWVAGWKITLPFSATKVNFETLSVNVYTLVALSWYKGAISTYCLLQLFSLTARGTCTSSRALLPSDSNGAGLLNPKEAKIKGGGWEQLTGWIQTWCVGTERYASSSTRPSIITNMTTGINTTNVNGSWSYWRTRVFNNNIVFC